MPCATPEPVGARPLAEQELRIEGLDMEHDQVQHMQTPSLTVATIDTGELVARHAALKEKLLRSAYTDYYTRTERAEWRDLLGALSAKHLEITGEPLR